MSSLQPREAVLDCSAAQEGVSGAWFEFLMQVCCLERLLLATEGVSGARRMRGGCPAQDLCWLGMWGTQEETWLSSMARKKTDLAQIFEKD